MAYDNNMQSVMVTTCNAILATCLKNQYIRSSFG